MERTTEVPTPQTSLPAPSRQRIPAMDGLRGVAVVMVLLYHSTSASFEGKGHLIALIGGLCNAGWVGVDLFFALSGFLITGILLDTSHDPLYFRKFYVRRFLRIFPLYYGLLLVCLLVTPVFHLDWHGTFLDFFLFLQNYVSYGRLTLTGNTLVLHLEHLWSLAIEEQFYLVWPFLVWVFRGRRSFVFLPAFLVLACPLARVLALHHGVSAQTIYLWSPFRIDSLAWGALAALVQRYIFGPPRSRLAFASVLLAACTLCGIVLKLHGSFTQFDPWVVQLGYSAAGLLSFGVLLLLLRKSSLLISFFSLPLLRWLGSLSYGIYVYHYLFSSYFGALRFYVARVTHSKMLGVVAVVGESFFVGIGLAWLSYNLYEKRWLQLKDKIARYTYT